MATNENKKFILPFSNEEFWNEEKKYWGAKAQDYGNITGKLEGLRYKLSVDSEKYKSIWNVNYGIQHVQVPIELYAEKNLLSREILVYCLLKKYRNNIKGHPKYGISYISIENLAKKYKLGKDTIVKCTRSLQDRDFIEKDKIQVYKRMLGKNTYYNQYRFPVIESKGFCSIPFGLLEDERLNIQERAFFCNIFDQFFLDHETCQLVLHKTYYEIGKAKNYSKKTVKKHLESIIAKQILKNSILVDLEFEHFKKSDGSSESYHKHLKESHENYEESGEENPEIRYGNLRSYNRYFKKDTNNYSAGESGEKKFDEERF